MCYRYKQVVSKSSCLCLECHSHESFSLLLGRKWAFSTGSILPGSPFNSKYGPNITLWYCSGKPEKDCMGGVGVGGWSGEGGSSPYSRLTYISPGSPDHCKLCFQRFLVCLLESSFLLFCALYKACLMKTPWLTSCSWYENILMVEGNI